MPSEFVNMLLKKAQGEQMPELPELDATAFSNIPRLELREDADGLTAVVVIGDKQYSRVDGKYYVFVRTMKDGEPNCYWRKVNTASVRIMKTIDEVLANGRENARTVRA
ncbi:hypothetical protein ACEOHC_003875 [Salmonella enterica]